MATPSGYPEFLQNCPAIQGRLSDYWLKGQWPVLSEHMTHLPFLASSDNRRDITQMITPGNGKVMTVNVTYRQRLLESLLTSNVSNPKCTATTTIGDSVQPYTIDPEDNINIERQVTQQSMRLNCESAQSYIDSVVVDMLDVLDRGTATKTATQSVALTGLWSTDVPFGDDPGERNNSNQLVLNTLVSAGKLNPQAYTDLFNGLNDSGFDEAYIFGGRAGRTWNQLIAAGCCTNDGIDLGEIHAQFGQVYGYDKRVANALGSDNELLILTLGAQQLLNYTAAMNDFKPGQAYVAATGMNYRQVVIQSPRTGVLYDFTFKDDCGTLHINGTATTKVIGLPNNLAVVGDPLRGVNGAFQGLIVNSWAS
jgi:hypothetical protein